MYVMSMNLIDLRRADLNLLVVFQALLAERHVGRAAQRLGLTKIGIVGSEQFIE